MASGPAAYKPRKKAGHMGATTSQRSAEIPLPTESRPHMGGFPPSALMSVQPNSPDPHWIGEALQFLLAKIIEAHGLADAEVGQHG